MWGGGEDPRRKQGGTKIKWHVGDDRKHKIQVLGTVSIYTIDSLISYTMIENTLTWI